MSTKEWIYEQDTPDIGCYQEITFEDDNNNPAVIQAKYYLVGASGHLKK